MKILKPFFGFVYLLLITTACEEQQRNFGEPPREYDAQSAVDNDSLISFLQKRFYNYEDYATAASNEQVTFTIDTIQGKNANKITLRDQGEEINFRIKNREGA